MKRTALSLRVRIPVIALVATGAMAVGAAFAHGPDHNPVRGQYVMKNGLPSEYKSLQNPLHRSTQFLAAGANLYTENCALCHGATGAGDGEGAADLNPRPPSLTKMYAMQMMDGKMMGGKMMGQMKGKMMGGNAAMGGTKLDAYSFWAISEGGEPLGSAMPAFKEMLSKQERWQIILYMSNGFNAKASGKSG